MAFHYKDNWFFERIKDGAVRIYHLDNSGLMDRGIAIDAASWASIIASVSARGETAETFGEAQDFHGKVESESGDDEFLKTTNPIQRMGVDNKR